MSEYTSAIDKIYKTAWKMRKRGHSRTFAQIGEKFYSKTKSGGKS